MTTEELADKKAEQLAEKWNVAFYEKENRGKTRYCIHGHSSTISDTKLEAINKYLKE